MLQLASVIIGIASAKRSAIVLSCSKAKSAMRLSQFDSSLVLLDPEDRLRYGSRLGINWFGHIYVIENRRTVALARVLLNAPKGMQVDHINHNKLDNRKANLRLVTPFQNSCNRRPHRRSLTGYRGVTVLKNGKFKASINTADGETKVLGVFATATEAAKAYNKSVEEYHGTFAYHNEIKTYDETRESKAV